MTDEVLAAMERLVAERPGDVRYSAPSSTPAPTHLRRYNRSLAAYARELG
jgi:hypothetical protein